MKPARKVIVEGNAGIGKTTLCTMLAEQWADGEIFSQFDCVLLLPLRERSVSAATTLSELFKPLHSSEKIRTSVVEELEEREGEDVLIIADGWDELDIKSRSYDSFVYNLLFGDIFPFVFVLLTSRPSASAALHNLPIVDRLVEVVGFSEENVKTFIELEFKKHPEKALSLIEQLGNNPVIHSVCSVPLNCAIICNLWHTLEQVLPRTLTELYAQVVLNVVLRNIKKRKILESLQSFDSIPADLQDLFWLTCKFAYQSLLLDKLVFTESEVKDYFPEIHDYSDKLLCFGLLQCARSLLPVGQGLSFHFIHLTIQEFLAALHLVTVSLSNKELSFYAKNDRFAMVLRFVFGLGCKRDAYGIYSRKIVGLNDEVIDHLLQQVLEYNAILSMCYCSLESLNDTVCSKVAKMLSGLSNFGISLTAYTPYDCAAVFHIFHYTSYCCNLDIYFEFCGLTDKLLRELTDILSSKGAQLQVHNLLIARNKLTAEGVIDLFNRGSASFSSLMVLNLQNNNIRQFPTYIFYKKLRVLNLSENPLGVSGIQSLETAIETGVLANIEKLYLSNTLTSDTDINGALLASLGLSIPSHCLCLRELDLSDNSLGVPGASALSLLIVRLPEEFELILSNTGFNYEATTALLDESHNRPSHLVGLILENNPFGINGWLAILRSLKNKFTQVNKLSFSKTDPTTLVDTNSQNFRLPSQNNFELTLRNNTLSYLSVACNDKIFILVEYLQTCESLKYLNCDRCSLTSREVIIILDSFESSGSIHKNFSEWSLTANFIDDEGVSALIKSMPKLFPRLDKVNIQDNLVSTEVRERLIQICMVTFTECMKNYMDTILAERQKLCSPPKCEEILYNYNLMWELLLREMVICILDQCTTKSEYHNTLSEPTKCDPQPQASCKPTTSEEPLASAWRTSTNSNDSTTNFHSAIKGQEKPISMQHQPLATDVCTPPTVQLAHSVEMTLSNDGTPDVNTTPQTTLCPHSTLSGVCGLETMTIEKLKHSTKVNDSQLDTEIKEADMILLASNFNNVETLCVQLRLTPAHRQDVKDTKLQYDTQTAVDKALRLWRAANPGAATYRALVEVVLRMGVNGVAIAEEVCKFLNQH